MVSPAEITRRQERLAAIAAAKARMEERHRQLDVQRGRTPCDERRPKDKDGKPKAGKSYKRDLGVPEPKAQDSFTDPTFASSRAPAATLIKASKRKQRSMGGTSQWLCYTRRHEFRWTCAVPCSRVQNPSNEGPRGGNAIA